MGATFKYNSNAKYSTKDLKGVYNSRSFSLLDIYLDEKRTSIKIQLPNIFKDHYNVAKPKPTTAGDECPLSLALWRKFHNRHGKYRPEFNEHFQIYRCHVNVAMFCPIGVLGIP